MKITTQLAIKYTVKNKKRSLYTILGIVIATVLITTVVTLLSSYQQFLANSVRNRKNWEAEFKNITYSDSLKIENDKNIREISRSRKLGTSEENFGTVVAIKLDVHELDKNALKNSNIKLIEGRLPENSNEIIISESTKNIMSNENNVKGKVGDKVNITLNGVKKEYTLVGKIESSEYDEGSFADASKVGAISYLDKSSISNDTIIDATILTKNIQKIYKTAGNLADNLNISKTEVKSELSEEQTLANLLKGLTENKNSNMPSLEYNGELLKYECVLDGNKEFTYVLLGVGCFLIFILGVTLVSMIKTSFNMSYSERIKELGMLASIGMDKKQRKHMIKIERIILGSLGIIIGLVLGLLLSYVVIGIVSNLASQIDYGQFLSVDNEIKLSMKVPILIILAIVLIVWFIVARSSKKPMGQIEKISPIDAINGNKNTKLTEKQVKHPKVIEKIFKEEGLLAYKNIKIDKFRNKAIESSLMISLILFLTISGLIGYINKIMSNTKESNYDDYIININPDKTNGYKINAQKIDSITKYLKDNDLIYDYYVCLESFYNTSIFLGQDKISSTVKSMVNDGVLNVNRDAIGNYEIKIKNFWAFGDTYNEILKRAGIKELNDNEMIIVNSIKEKTKYGNKIDVTNLKVGDKLSVDIGKSIGRKESIEQTYTIAGIIDDLSPYLNNSLSNGAEIIGIISPEYAMKLIDEYDYILEAYINIKTDEKKAAKIDECMNDIKKMYGENAAVIGDNHLPSDFSRYSHITEREDVTKISTNKVSLSNTEKLIKIMAYSFIGVVAFISAITVFNTIYTCVILRRRDFAALKSIGMTNKQLRKMTYLDTLFYGLNSGIYGIILSLVILYVLYLFLTQSSLYMFEIPWSTIFGSLIVIYAVIFLAIICARKEIKSKNLIDEIRDENI